MMTSELIQNINAAAEATVGKIREDERQELLKAIQTLTVSLETPIEVIAKMALGPINLFVIKLAIEMKLFDEFSSNMDKEIVVDDLAVAISADTILVARIMRVLSGIGLFRETGEKMYTATPSATMYASSSPIAAAILHFSTLVDVLTKLSDYFAERGFKNPSDAYDGPFQYARQTKLHYFDWLAVRPEYQKNFNTTMSMSPKGAGVPWFDYYPVTEKLVVNSASDPLLVDVGGGQGHNLITFKEKFPNITGRLIVQDLPVVVRDIHTLPSGIEAMRYDFFEPQPVQRAKAYYMRHVLHDWPDKQARSILDNVKLGMGPKSVLLIDEDVLPEVGVPLLSAQMDTAMMVSFSSLERTTAQYEKLLKEAGFIIVSVRAQPGGTTMLFEAIMEGV